MEGSLIISVGSRLQALMTLGYKEYAYVLVRVCICIALPLFRDYKMFWQITIQEVIL